MSFEAQYVTPCAGICGNWVRPGERVEYEGEFLRHVECAHEPPAQPLCTDCFLFHPIGACDA